MDDNFYEDMVRPTQSRKLLFWNKLLLLLPTNYLLLICMCCSPTKAYHMQYITPIVPMHMFLTACLLLLLFPQTRLFVVARWAKLCFLLWAKSTGGDLIPLQAFLSFRGVILIPVVYVVVVSICRCRMSICKCSLQTGISGNQTNGQLRIFDHQIKSTAKKMLRRKNKHNAPLRFHSHPLTNLISALLQHW